MTNRLPLFTHCQHEETIAWYHGQAVSVGTFLAQAHALAARLPAGDRVLNLCENRYHFLLGLVAALLRDRLTVLPPHRAPQTLQGLAGADGACLLCDDGDVALQGLGLPLLAVEPDSLQATGSAHSTPQFDAKRCVIELYTSGSSGSPQAQRKRWGELVAGARLTIERLTLQPATALLASVPAQHMFGLESSIMLPLQRQGVVVDSRPLLPADLAAALAQLPVPRALVTTPLQLRACGAERRALPACDFILSATAPLDNTLATEVESLSASPVLEIYGSTESGAIATRRPARDSLWHTLPGIEVAEREGQWWLLAGHLPAPLPLHDRLRRQGNGFALLGRQGDLIKIAGKRTSLAELNRQLLAIDGVEDGAFLLPDHTAGREVTLRLAALVVAPSLDSGQLMTRLRERIDAAFLPRPLRLVASLPRTSTGKLPREEALALLGLVPATARPREARP